MKDIEDFRPYFESISAIAPLPFSYTHPIELLEIIQAKTALPYFVERITKYPFRTIGEKIPDDFKGWHVSYFVDQTIESQFNNWGMVHVYPKNIAELKFTQFVFVKDFVISYGVKPFVPLAHYISNRYDYNIPLASAVNETEYEINMIREEIKKVVFWLGCTKVYYANLQNKELVEILFNNITSLKEKERQLKKDFKLVKYSSWHLKRLDLNSVNNIVFEDLI